MISVTDMRKDGENMKTNKICSILLAVAMLLSLCACGSSPSGTQTVTEGPAVSGTTSAEPEATAEPEETFSVGATVNNSYINEYFGIGLKLDENWTFSTQEEIDETNGFVQDTLDDETYTKALDSGMVYTDMIATGDDGMLSVNATIEKLNAVSTLALNEDSYIDLSLEQNDFRALLGQIGLDVTVLEKGSIEVAGKEHPGIVIEGTIQGVAFYEKIVAIKSGSYVLTVTATSLMDNVVDGIFGYFYAL